MITKIYHTVNSGLYLWNGGTGLLIDGLHRGSREGFSDTPPNIMKYLQQESGPFSNLDGLLFTHLHDDHYDGELVNSLMRVRRIPAIGPGLESKLIHPTLLSPCARKYRIGQADVIAWDTVHDGNSFAAVPHWSLMIRMGGECFFIAGDAFIAPGFIERICEFCDVLLDAAFVNLYQIHSEEGQIFLRRLAPKRVFLYHLPFINDDRYGYQEMAKQVVRRFSPDSVKPEWLIQMEWLDGNPNNWNPECEILPE